MISVILSIEGMKCGMCESHVSDVIRRVAPVKHVKASHVKNEASFQCEEDVDLEQIREAIEEQGYHVLTMKTEPYQKKSWLSFHRKG